MGWDISFHPISESELFEWYFDRLPEIKRNNTRPAKKIAKKWGIPNLHIKNYINILKEGAKTKHSISFNSTHCYFCAIVQGFFRPYQYVRGAAFTFALEANPNLMEGYIKKWEDIVPPGFENPILNKLNYSYSGGAYLPNENLERLIHDYKTNPEVKDCMDYNLKGEKNVEILFKAVHYAIDNGLGVLEATEVIEPKPFDLNNSRCRSNLHNCDPEGALLYAQAAVDEIKEIAKTHPNILIKLK